MPSRGCRRATSARIPTSVVPEASARAAAAWFTGPSAIGSLNGTPSSSTSAPARRERDGEPLGRREVGIAGGDVGDERRPALRSRTRERLRQRAR